MMTAKQARKQSKQGRVDATQEERDLLIMDITNSAKLGYTHITIYKLSDANKEFVESLGYKVTVPDTSGYYMISWK